MDKISINQLVLVSQFLEKHVKNAIDIKTAFKWNKLGKAIADDVLFFRTRYTELFQKYGEEKDGNYQILPEHIEAYNEEMSKLLALEVDLPAIRFSLEEFSGLLISPEELLPLMPFIEENE